MNAERRIPMMVLVVVSLALMLLVPTESGAQTEPARLSDVTVTPQADSVTVFVKTSREASYKADLVDSPSRLVIDLEDTVYAWRKTPLNVGKDPIKQVRGGQYRQGVARVVLDLSRAVGYAIREEPNGLAIVIPTAAPAAGAVANASTTRPTNGAAPRPLAAAAPAPVQIAQAPATPPAQTVRPGKREILSVYPSARLAERNFPPRSRACRRSKFARPPPLSFALVPQRYGSPLPGIALCSRIRTPNNPVPICQLRRGHIGPLLKTVACVFVQSEVRKPAKAPSPGSLGSRHGKS